METYIIIIIILILCVYFDFPMLTKYRPEMKTVKELVDRMALSVGASHDVCVCAPKVRRHTAALVHEAPALHRWALAVMCALVSGLSQPPLSDIRMTGRQVEHELAVPKSICANVSCDFLKHSAEHSNVTLSTSRGRSINWKIMEHLNWIHCRTR